MKAFSLVSGTRQLRKKLLCALFIAIITNSFVYVIPSAFASETEPLELTCTYTTPRVGTPTTFTMHGSGGSGTYKYLQNYVHVYLDGTYTDDADWTYKRYTTDNTFEYTFVAPGTYELRLYIMDVGSSPIDTARTTFTVTVEGTGDDLTIEQAANQLAQETLDAGCVTDYEKALYVHDWLIEHATYDHTLEYDGESGVLLRGTGTCESFYRAYALVLKRLGIQSERATGNGHVWNRLLLDGAWTHVDATWDADQNSAGDQALLSHLYFGLTDDMIQEAHNEYTPVVGQEATSYASNYYLQSGNVTLWAQSLCEAISQAIEAGGTAFETPTQPSLYPTMYAVMGRAAAYYARHQDWGNYEVNVELVLQGELNKESFYRVSVSEKASDTTTPNEPDPAPSTPSEPATPSDPEETPPVTPDDSDSPTNPDNGGTSSGDASSSTNSTEGSTGSEANGSEAEDGTPSGKTPSTAGQWIEDATGWWYRFADGSYAHRGWELIDGNWYYFSRSGYMQTGWIKDGAWYYLKPNGTMATGWQHVGASWYYLKASGAMATGWQSIHERWYYLQPDSGTLATGWIKDGSTWYYANQGGALVTGWLNCGGTWYYLKTSGAMATGWQNIRNTWYFFYDSGAMAANTSIGSYRLNSSGVWVA